MALVDHRTVEPAQANGVAPQKPQRPAPPTTKQALTAQAVGKKVDDPAVERDGAPGFGWALFLGAIIGLALMKEMLGRIGGSPVTVRARSVSRSVARTEKVFSIGAIVGTIARIGARVLGSRA